MKIPLGKLAVAVVAGMMTSVAGAQVVSGGAQNTVKSKVKTPGPPGFILGANPGISGTPAPAPAGTPAPTPAPAPAPVVRQVVPEPPLSAEELAKRDRKKLDFQIKQAEAGRDYARYELGMRYLKGDGVEKDPELALKWIKLAAEQEYTLAIRKLAELEKGK